MYIPYLGTALFYPTPPFWFPPLPTIPYHPTPTPTRPHFHCPVKPMACVRWGGAGAGAGAGAGTSKARPRKLEAVEFDSASVTRVLSTTAEAPPGRAGEVRLPTQFTPPSFTCCLLVTDVRGSYYDPVGRATVHTVLPGESRVSIQCAKFALPVDKRRTHTGRGLWQVKVPWGEVTYERDGGVSVFCAATIPGKPGEPNMAVLAPLPLGVASLSCDMGEQLSEDGRVIVTPSHKMGIIRAWAHRQYGDRCPDFKGPPAQFPLTDAMAREYFNRDVHLVASLRKSVQCSTFVQAHMFIGDVAESISIHLKPSVIMALDSNSLLLLFRIMMRHPGDPKGRACLLLPETFPLLYPSAVATAEREYLLAKKAQGDGEGGDQEGDPSAAGGGGSGGGEEDDEYNIMLGGGQTQGGGRVPPSTRSSAHEDEGVLQELREREKEWEGGGDGEGEGEGGARRELVAGRTPAPKDKRVPITLPAVESHKVPADIALAMPFMSKAMDIMARVRKHLRESGSTMVVDFLRVLGEPVTHETRGLVQAALAYLLTCRVLVAVAPLGAHGVPVHGPNGTWAHGRDLRWREYGGVFADLEHLPPLTTAAYAELADSTSTLLSGVVRAHAQEFVRNPSLFSEANIARATTVTCAAWREQAGFHLAEEQVRAAQNAIVHPVSIVKGVGGTGKTVVLPFVVMLSKEVHRTPVKGPHPLDTASGEGGVSASLAKLVSAAKHGVAMVAFTNGAVLNATKRVHKCMPRGKGPAQPKAMTIHSFANAVVQLRIMLQSKQGVRMTNPCAGVHTLIVEEMSMVSLALFNKLMRAMNATYSPPYRTGPKGRQLALFPDLVRLVCIGDPNQLLPVGPGDPMKALCTCLEECDARDPLLARGGGGGGGARRDNVLVTTHRHNARVKAVSTALLNRDMPYIKSLTQKFVSGAHAMHTIKDSGGVGFFGVRPCDMMRAVADTVQAIPGGFDPSNTLILTFMHKDRTAINDSVATWLTGKWVEEREQEAKAVKEEVEEEAGAGAGADSASSGRERLQAQVGLLKAARAELMGSANSPLIVGLHYIGATCNGNGFPGSQRFLLVGGSIVTEERLKPHLLAFRTPEQWAETETPEGATKQRKQLKAAGFKGHQPLDVGTILQAPAFEKLPRGGGIHGPKCLVLEVVFTEEEVAAQREGRAPVVTPVVVRGGNPLGPSELTHCKYVMRTWFLQLGYAITVNRSQGTEADLVIYVLTKSFRVCSRLMNVGITRAKARGCVFLFEDDEPRDGDVAPGSILHKFVMAGFTQRDEVLEHCLRASLGHVLTVLPPARLEAGARDVFTTFPPYCEFQRRKEEKLGLDIPPVWDPAFRDPLQEERDRLAREAREKEKRDRVRARVRRVVPGSDPDPDPDPVPGPGPGLAEEQEEDAGLLAAMEAFERGGGGVKKRMTLAEPDGGTCSKKQCVEGQES